MSTIQEPSTHHHQVIQRVDAPPLERAWKEFAACKGQTKLFFPPKSERPEARVRREAKAQRLCEACAVQSTCRDQARARREYGYWGGESEEDRHVAGFTVSLRRM